MPWSTRELAELAGTTVNTVRHYHALGLLEEPERIYNGYKQYGARDLVKLIRIRRLADLGVPLAHIDAVGASTESAAEILSELDLELCRSIQRLSRARTDIATILRENAPADAPAGFESVAPHLSESDVSILHIFSQLFDHDAMTDLRRMVESGTFTGALGREIDALPSDADDVTRSRLAARLAPALVQNAIDYPWLNDPTSHLSRSGRVARHTFLEAVAELYNPAQVDVFSRAGELARNLLASEVGDVVTHTPEVA